MLDEGSAVYKAITKPPRQVVKWLPPSLLIAALLLVIVLGFFLEENVNFESAHEFMSAIVSLGLFFGGMWVILSKGYPPKSTKYAVGAILLVCYHYLGDAVGPAMKAVGSIFGGAG